MQFLFAQKRAPRSIIHLQPAVGEYSAFVHHSGLQGSQPALGYPQAGQQFLHGERLGQIVICPGIQRLNLIRVLAAGANHNDRQIRPGADTVNHRQSQIQQHDVRIVRTGFQNSGFPVGRREKTVIVRPQSRCDQTADRRIVLHDQNQGFIHAIQPPQLVW